MMQTIVTLIKTATSQDGANYSNIESRTTVFAERKSPTRAEFYASSQAGFAASIVLRVYSAEYHKETIVEIDKKRYRIIRAYQTGEMYTELTCTEER